MSASSGIEAERWRDNWRTLTTSEAVRIELPGGAGATDAVGRVRGLSAGTPVVLSASGPAAARRCRKFAARAGVQLEREFLAIPTASAPGCLVENAPGPVGTFIRTVLVAPHQTRLGLVLDAGLALLRVIATWRLFRAIVPGRIAVGTRK